MGIGYSLEYRQGTGAARLRIKFYQPRKEFVAFCSSQDERKSWLLNIRKSIDNELERKVAIEIWFRIHEELPLILMKVMDWFLPDQEKRHDGGLNFTSHERSSLLSALPKTRESHGYWIFARVSTRNWSGKLPLKGNCENLQGYSKTSDSEQKELEMSTLHQPSTGNSSSLKHSKTD